VILTTFSYSKSNRYEISILQLPALLTFLLLANSAIVLGQNQHPEPEVLGGIQPERGQVLEQGYGGEYDETILGLTNTSFGVVACGWEEDATGNKRVVIYEIDSIGVLLNKYTYNTSGEQIANSIFPDGLGGYYVAGRSSLSYADFDEMNIGDTAWVFRIDNTGSILWEQKYKNTNEAEVGMNLLDAGNGYFWLLTNIINTQSGNQVRWGLFCGGEYSYKY